MDEFMNEVDKQRMAFPNLEQGTEPETLRPAAREGQRQAWEFSSRTKPRTMPRAAQCRLSTSWPLMLAA
jgi:hypothetical protein